jgi:hypothetical protein
MLIVKQNLYIYFSTLVKMYLVLHYDILFWYKHVQIIWCVFLEQINENYVA